MSAGIRGVMTMPERLPCQFETLDKGCAMGIGAVPCLFNLAKFDDLVCRNYTPVSKDKTYGAIIRAEILRGMGE